MATSELPHQCADLSAKRVVFSLLVSPASAACVEVGVVLTKQHEQTVTRLLVVRVRRMREGKRREQKSGGITI